MGRVRHDRIDAGTKFLLLKAPPPASTGDLLDIGCGTGAIALAMAQRSPGATVWAVDVNERARDLCRGNAERNGLANVRVCAPDDVPADAQFATIWSNPAIRIGKPALHAMLLRWLTRLSPGGQAVLVVHKHLGSDSCRPG
jgi:16S rRNA (guanine1207-N2)-methyltransferase